MAPPDPKRPPRSPPSEEGEGVQRVEEGLKEGSEEGLDEATEEQPGRELPAVELPFDDGEVAPLRADEPSPQHVPQFPAGKRRRVRGRKDRELAARYDGAERTDEAPRSLYVERGPGAGQLLPVHTGSLLIGRSSASHLRLSHPSISRRHAELTRHGDRFALRDLRSQNGTYVNRRRVRGEVEVYCGDELRVGNAVLRLRGAGAPRRPPRVKAPPQPAPAPGPLLLWSAGGALLLLLLAAGALALGAPPQRAALTDAEAAVLASYEAGDLDVALALARAEGLVDLTAQLTQLRAAWTAAERAGREEALEEARAQLRTALELDAWLARGAGPVALDLRQSLSRVHVQLGRRHVLVGKAAAAEEEFRAALQLDASNAEARTALEQLLSRPRR